MSRILAARWRRSSGEATRSNETTLSEIMQSASVAEDNSRSGNVPRLWTSFLRIHQTEEKRTKDRIPSAVNESNWNDNKLRPNRLGLYKTYSLKTVRFP